MELPVPSFPVQTAHVVHKSARCTQTVVMAAYEVYCHLYGPQKAMITGGCRGGFSTGELIGFLYARAFPKDEWHDRVEEAWRGMAQL